MSIDIHSVINLRDKAHSFNAKGATLQGDYILYQDNGKKIEPVNYNVARLIFTAEKLNGHRTRYHCYECTSEYGRAVYHYTSNEFDIWRDGLSTKQRNHLQLFYDLVKY